MGRPSQLAFTDHARSRMAKRGLSPDDVLRVVQSPEHTEEARPGRVVHQARIDVGRRGKVYLVRVFVDVGHDPLRVVTAYRTTRFARYGSSPP
jgi:hypothetical protein